ncbi:MAG: hypothetical protein PHQ35_04440 [Phycisphaerae bacterium]|nr:hypothetical protein [Phycisphaerae bacterium]MDD5380233.1 hypothetical protein [Phycisphaerae bacterium]
MDFEQEQQKNLIDTTDCLEAINVFRGWKNFLFVVVILCLLLLQASFWLVNTGYVPTGEISCDKAVAAAVITEPVVEDAKAKEDVKKEDIKKAAEQVAAPNEPAKTATEKPQSKLANFHFKIEFKHLTWLISLVNFALIFAAILYCLTMLFSLKVSLLGRLGGINHISRAFFLSLVFIVFLLPWQIPWREFFAGGLFGAMYTPGQLQSSFAALKDSGIFYKTFYYLRFSGYWLIVLLLLIFSYIRSCRWAKTILRRLEVI